ncbi:hypothetical protein BFL34_01563 [Clavibacter michiganensis]|uniref:Uncharacterized protein n=1 Tax=Clavibacter michiganensis TaxID=28447 RepID=A0A251Y903_9MICO|nr:hypothetical protein [Clavibacter michiganensis]OUE20745.1 hypothetical protein BFL34_01563 [Clavibacter michiganensis]
MGDDDAERRGTKPAWMRRSTPAEMRDQEEFRTQNAIVKFYAVIPLMIMAVFLPTDPLRAIWMALVVVGYVVWGVRNVMRASRKRTASDETHAASADDEGDHPVGGPGR